MDDNLYCDEKTGIVLNKRQITGKETSKKARKNSVSKYKEQNNNNNIQNKNCNINNINDDEKEDSNNNIENYITNDKDSIINYNKTTLKNKKEREISLNAYNNYENNFEFF